MKSARQKSRLEKRDSENMTGLPLESELFTSAFDKT